MIIIDPHEYLGALHSEEAALRQLFLPNTANNRRPLHQYPAINR